MIKNVRLYYEAVKKDAVKKSRQPSLNQSLLAKAETE